MKNVSDSYMAQRRSLLKAALLTPVVLGGGGLLAACGSDESTSAAGLVKQTFTTSSGFIPSFMDTYVAAQQGIWRKKGLDITVRGGQGTATSLQSVIAGSAQYGRGSGNGIQSIINDGAPIKFFLQAYREPAFTIASMPDKAITHPSQLKGKKVGVVSAGGETELLLQIMLAEANVPMSSVKTPVAGVGPGAYALAERGKIDAWIALDQDLLVLKNKGIEVHSFNMGEYVHVPQQAYYASADVFEKNRDEIVKFAAGLLDAYAFIRKPDNFAKVLASVKHYDSTIVESALHDAVDVTVDKWYMDGDDKLGLIEADKWQKGLDQMKARGAINKMVPLDTLYDAKVVEEARKL